MGVNAPTLLRRASATSFTTTVELLPPLPLPPLLPPLALPPLLPPPLLLPLLELLVVVVVVVAALTKEVSRIVRISLQASEGSKSVECAA